MAFCSRNQIETACKLQKKHILRGVKLYPTQDTASDNLAHALLKHNLACDLSDMGVGKSYHGIATAHRLGLRPFFVAPLAVHHDLRKAFALTGVAGTVVNYEHLRTENCQYVRREVGAAGETTGFRWRFPARSLLVYDEAQALCNDTQNGAIATAAHEQEIPILAMSATLAHTPLDFFTLGKMMGLHKGSDFENWALRHGAHLQSVRIQGQSQGTVKFNPFTAHGRRGLLTLRGQVVGDRGCRITRGQFGGFPKTEIRPRIIYAGPEQTAMVNRAYAELAEPMQEISKKVAIANGQTPAVRRLRLRQEIEMAKVPFVADLARQAVVAGESVAIFVTYSETLEQLKRALADLNPGIIAGDVPEKRRGEAKDAFQSDQIRVMLVQIQAGGAGLSLHDITGKHHRHGFLLPADSLRCVVQATGRLARAGSLSDAVYDVIFFEGTVEEEICNGLAAKSAGLALFNDGEGLGCLDDLATFKVGRATQREAA